jgi:hypothetical protein
MSEPRLEGTAVAPATTCREKLAQRSRTLCPHQCRRCQALKAGPPCKSLRGKTGSLQGVRTRDAIKNACKVAEFIAEKEGDDKGRTKCEVYSQ